jgi:hypothetical protein
MAAGLIEILGRDRPYHFFDSFSGLPSAKEIDGDAALQWQQNVSSPVYYDNCTASQEEFMATIRRTGAALGNIHVHRGFFDDTVGTAEVGKIAILRLDCDWYDSTMCCLQAFMPKMARGGLVIIDDYGTWDGCTRAVHDYFSENKRPEAIGRYGTSAIPCITVRDERV